MDAHEKINRVYNTAKKIPINDSSKIVLISDCHRGDASWSDDFSKNQNIYFYALTHYYNGNYTYIELGDGDELWENKHMSQIKAAHTDVFWLLSLFYSEGRFFSLYGNHDIVKKNKRFVYDNLTTYYDEREKKDKALFPGINIYEGLLLHYTETNDNIFLIHGHQGDLLNDTLWPVARFLVRYIWRPLDMFGVNNPTSPAQNYSRKEKVTRRLYNWAKREGKMLIAGHTHRPAFPEPGKTLYFNDGSCVHPRCITAIEIADGSIMLVKWCIHTRKDASLFVAREILAGPVLLKEYFDKH